MAFPDSFWVPQSEIPPNEILFIFIFLHSLLILFLVICYIYIHSRISPNYINNVSLPGTSPTLRRNLQWIFLGLGLIVTDNLLTHIIALIYTKDGYYSVGAKSTGIIIGFAMFFFNISRFLTEILRVPKSFNPRSLNLIRIMNYGYLVSFTMILLLSIFGVGTQTISWIFVITTGLMGIFFTTEFYVIFSSHPTDRVNQLRTLLASFVGVGMIALLLFSINFIPPDGVSPSKWPTRDARIEVLLIGTDLWVFYTSSMLILMVVLPRNLRLIVGINDDEFNLYRDERIDIDWNRISSWDMMEIDNTHVSEYDSLVFIDDKLSYVESDFTLNPDSMSYFFQLTEFQNQYLDNYIKDKSDLTIIATKDSLGLEEIYLHIADYYDFTLGINDHLQVNSFVYKIEGYTCGMIVCIPSLWNPMHKLWMIIGSSDSLSYIIKLYTRFKSFFKMVAEEEQIFVVAKIPHTQEGMLNEVPSMPNDVEIPDFRFLIFL